SNAWPSRMVSRASAGTESDFRGRCRPRRGRRVPRLAPITSLASRLLPCYSAGVSFVATCAQCREEVLEPDVIGDEEECALWDHLLASHAKMVQPETRVVLLIHFVSVQRMSAA